MPRPAAGDYSTFNATYIDKVEADSIPAMVKKYAFDLQEFYNALPDEKADYAYAEHKWTVKQMLQHINDAERVFSYRVLRISRGDATPLPGFEQDDYIKNDGSEMRSLSAVKQEFNAVRASTDILLLSLTPEQTLRRGIASSTETTVNAIAFVIYGHLLHHRQILQQRYL